MSNYSEPIFIPLTQGQVAIVDVEDYRLVAGFRWHAHKDKSQEKYTWYAKTTMYKNGKYFTLFMHRLILPGVDRVDHKDRCGLNNQRHNLRPTNQTQNQFNSNGRKRVSLYKGVTFRITAKSKHWQASIRYLNKKYFLGSFATQEEAALAYDRAALQIAGEFACLNFPNVVALV